MLEDTGERVIPKEMDPLNPLLLEHIARYQFALPYIKKGRVLDLASGSGFGTHMIAKRRKKQIDEVIGVDIDKDAVKYAIDNYYHPLSTYRTADATNPELVEELGTFDTILSFETLEHIEEEQTLLDNYYRLLKPGGILIVSTPFGEGRGVPSGQRFHVHQLTQEEFRNLFTNYEEVEYFYQNGVLIEPKREGAYYPLGIAVCTKTKDV
ncbi:SAM-dependent methyltransferase [Halalkalibacillus sediminis]|uniref:SAM-dependent methyltransferase n=1 Tax=Halalkalibacillus sediminis TaxID=2018042 RepID=A0A2I0QRR3_9BACI|nr:class I SAM-dependent methyltransferase [Halalkalibacillus sediminis]PKR77022.1 SAM-dependent methyltransferase [Halalkalibacillus sediminis]